MLLMLIILIVLRVANYSPCMGYRRFSSVVIHDPTGVSKYFSDIIHTEEQPSENKNKREFAHWSVEDIKKKCFHAIVDGALFVILDEGEAQHVSDRYNFDRRTFHTHLHETFLLREGEWKLPSAEAASREVTTLFGAPTHYCTAIERETEFEQFAIASADHHDALFLLKKNSNDLKYKIIAIVEPVPKFDLQTLRRKDVEAAYLTGTVQQEFSDNEEKPKAPVNESQEDDFSLEDDFEDDDDYYRRVCDLDEFRKYRLCATAYTAWMQFKNALYSDTNYIVRPGNACMKKEKIVLTAKVHTKTIEADLLACSIRTDSSNSQIFIANDHFTDDSAFVLETVYANDESIYSEESVDGEIVGYGLVLHLHNVLSLKKFDDGD